MYCSQCGSYINNNSKFCGTCGNPLVNCNSVSMNNYDIGIKEKQGKNNDKKIFLLLSGCIIVLVLTIVLILGIRFFKSDFGRSIFNNGSSDNNASSNNKDGYKQLDIDKGTRTLMIYVIGSNLESQMGAATSDIEEMIDSNFNDEDINVVLYLGGAKRWMDPTIKKNSIYEIVDGELNKVQTYSSTNMTDPKTLTTFIDYVYEHYESDLYDLVLWDHGGGPIQGYGHDENYNTSAMSLTNFEKALNDSKLLKETKFELIGFDACLMSSIEIVNLLKEEANYFVASAEAEPGDGWNYDFLSEIDETTSSVELGKLIVDYYDEFYNDSLYDYGYNYDYEVTLSLIDLRKTESFVSLLNDFFGDVDGALNQSNYSTMTRKVSNMLQYGYISNQRLQFDLFDLSMFIKEFKNYGDHEEIQKKFKELVIYEKGNIDDSSGISIYFPLTTKGQYGYYKNIYKTLLFSDNYLNFLDDYIKIANGNKIIKSDVSKTIPSKDNSAISLSVADDIYENYQSIDYVVFRKEEDGSMLPIYTSSDVEVKDGLIKADIPNRRISVSNLDGSGLEDVIVVESKKDSTSVTYTLIGLLEKWDDDDFIGTYETNIVEISLKVDNQTNEGEIINIKSVQEEVETLGKVTYNLNDWKTISFLSSSYFLYDENGNKLSDWQKSGTMYGTQVNIKEGFKFKATTLDTNREYYYMFRVKDTQGNVQETDLLKAN